MAKTSGLAPRWVVYSVAAYGEAVGSALALLAAPGCCGLSVAECDQVARYARADAMRAATLARLYNVGGCGVAR